ncbi:MAG TPA: tRNA epoxyqueuosine(34) reductase QueG [Polyangiaceae bacterium]|jgi:epoxyqueuosine reductase|nr:tRNA epoxyqueuosine(34) reductase QueG [Polyangiaceae bacterium]
MCPSERAEAGSGGSGAPGARWYFPPSASEGTAPAAGPTAAKTPHELSKDLSAAALELGFTRIGFAPVERFERGGQALERWLSQGHAGEMGYLAQSGDRADPRALLESARTLVVVVMSYAGSRAGLVPLTNREGRALTGSIARYARGSDYHQVLKQRLHRLADRSAELAGRPVLARACVDTAPLLEREAAAAAGLGFIGKNTLAIVAGLGSYVLLGELLLDLEVRPEPASLPDGERPQSRPAATPEAHCGSCRACLDACPTGAFVDAHVLDARRCISYLTIEFTGVIPRELRTQIGTRVFGCDVCQEVCPYNASATPRPVAAELAPRADREQVDLASLLDLGSAGYRKFVKRSALSRASRATLARNAAIALGNLGQRECEAPLVKALLHHYFPIVRGHAAWALGALAPVATRAAPEALTHAAACDQDGWVREEARLALDAFS